MLKVIKALELLRLIMGFLCMGSIFMKKWYLVYVCAMLLALMVIVEIILGLVCGSYVPMTFGADVLMVFIWGFIVNIAEKHV